MRRRRRWALHGLAWVIGLVSFRVALIPAQSCRGVTIDEIERAIRLGSDWAVTNLLDDGSYTYRYDRAEGEDLGGYNMVRHAGLVNTLYQAVLAGDVGYIEAADAGLDFMLQRTVSHHDWVAFADPPGDVRLGGSSLFLAALVHRRRATGDTRHDDTMHATSRFLMSQQDETGAPAAFYDPSSGAPVPARFGPFATGEAAWALAMMETDFPGRGYGEASDSIIRYVVEDRRERENRLIRLPDHWLSYAIAERDRPLDANESRYVERLAGDFALMSRVEATRSESGIQSFLRYGHALGAGVGTMGEGIGGLWRLADAGHGLATQRDAIAERMECVASILLDRQIVPETVRSSAEYEVGAWFRRDVTQMDDQQHSISALIAARDILSEETTP